MNQDEINQVMSELRDDGFSSAYAMGAQLETERDAARERVKELERQVADLESALAEGQEVWAEARRVGPQHLDYTPTPATWRTAEERIERMKARRKALDERLRKAKRRF